MRTTLIKLPVPGPEAQVRFSAQALRPGLILTRHLAGGETELWTFVRFVPGISDACWLRDPGGSIHPYSVKYLCRSAHWEIGHD